MNNEQPGISTLPTPQTPVPRSKSVLQRVQIYFELFSHRISGSEQEIPRKGFPRQMVVRSSMTQLSVSSTHLKLLLHRSQGSPPYL